MEKEAYRIKVGVRVRPMMPAERESGAQNVLGIDNNDTNHGIVISKKNGDSYSYDWAFELSAEQRTVYNCMCKSLIDDLFKGFNATFLAYGQTGSGKTFTMGTADMQNGIIPYAMRDIFEKRNEITKKGSKVEINISFIEIYMEECYDLLCKKQHQDVFDKTRLDLRETSSGETSLDGLSTWPVYDVDSVAMYLNEASKVRSTGSTAMNSQSSRSHAICTIYVRVTLPTEQSQNTPVVLLSKLHLVDLAGSERAKKTLATGDAFQEGISINKGLLALGNVVAALANKTTTSGHVHVPYRESKLTRLLKDSLGGNGMTVLLACISPAENNYDETINTLRFASRASSVVNRAKVNLDITSEGSEANAALIKEVSALKLQVEELQSKLHDRVEELQGRDNDAMIKNLICRLVSRMRSLLINCLEDDISIEDSEVSALKTDLSDLRRYFHIKERQPDKPTAEDVESDGIEMLPAIMSAIEDIKALRSELSGEMVAVKARNPSHSNSSEMTELDEQDILTCDELLRQQINSLDIDDDMLLRIGEDSEVNNEDDIDIDVFLASSNKLQEEDDDFEGEPNAQVYQELCKKEAEMTEIDIKSTEFAASIDQLNNDIAALRSEQQKLLLKQKANVGVSSQLTTSQALASSSINKKPAQNVSAHTIKSSLMSNSQISHKETNEDLRIKRDLKEKSRLLEEKMKALKSKESELSKITTQKDKLANEVSNMRTVVDEQKKQRTTLQRKMREDNATFQTEKDKLKFSEIQSKRRELLAQQSLSKLGNQLQNKEKVWKGQLDAMERQSKLLKEQLLKKEQARRIRADGEDKTSTHLTTAKLGDLKQMLSSRCDQQVKIALIQNQLSQAVTKRNLVHKQLTNSKDETQGENVVNDDADTEAKMINDEVNQLVKQLKDANREKPGSPFSKEVQTLKEAKVVVELLFSMATRAQLQEKLLQCQVDKMQEQLIAHHTQLQKMRSTSNKKRRRFGGASRRRRDGDEDGEVLEESDNSDSDMLDETFYPSDEERRREAKQSSRPGKRKEKSTSSNSSGDTGGSESIGHGEDNSQDEKKQRPKKMKRPAVEIISSTAGIAKKVKAQLQVRPGDALGPEEVQVPASNKDDAVKSFSQYTVKEIKALLKDRGLSVTGVKEELIERLVTGVPSSGRLALSSLPLQDGERTKKPTKKDGKVLLLLKEGQENYPEVSNTAMPHEGENGQDCKTDDVQLKKRKLVGEGRRVHKSIVTHEHLDKNHWCWECDNVFRP